MITRRRTFLIFSSFFILIKTVNDAAKGYPNVAAFLDSDDGFAIYRRFGWIQSILLMNKQENLRRLELRLGFLQRRMVNKNEAAFSSLDIQGSDEDKQEYQDLLASAETTFCAYTDLLNASQKMLSFAKPAEADRQNLGMYLHNRKPLMEDEWEWVQHKEDLITIKSGREHAWLDGVVEFTLKSIHCRFIDFLFRSKVWPRRPYIDFFTNTARNPERRPKSIRIAKCLPDHQRTKTCTKSFTPLHVL